MLLKRDTFYSRGNRDLEKVTCPSHKAGKLNQESSSKTQAFPHHISLPLIETDRHKSGRIVRRKSHSSQKAVGKLWLAFQILPGWEEGGGEFIYRQKGSTSSRRKMNDINFSHSSHWDWA